MHPARCHARPHLSTVTVSCVVYLDKSQDWLIFCFSAVRLGYRWRLCALYFFFQAISFGLGYFRNVMVGQDDWFGWDGQRDYALRAVLITLLGVVA